VDLIALNHIIILHQSIFEVTIYIHFNDQTISYIFLYLLKGV